MLLWRSEYLVPSCKGKKTNGDGCAEVSNVVGGIGLVSVMYLFNSGKSGWICGLVIWFGVV